MPAGSISYLIWLIILVLFSGFFSATETAYSCASKIKLRTFFNEGNRLAGLVLELCEEKYDKLLSTILVGNNIVNLTAAGISAIFFTLILKEKSVDPTFVSTIVITVAVLIFGEITPKYIAKTFPEKMAMLFYPVIKFFYYIFIPVNFIFSGWKWLISHVFKLKNIDVITEAEIMTIVEEAAEDGTLKKDETKLIKSVIEFDDLEVQDILTPRVNLTALDSKATMQEAKLLFEKSGFSRIPVYKDSIDSIIGIIHQKDFYRVYVEGKESFSEVIQEAYFTTQFTKISRLLKILQKKRMQMAVVIDEYGGTFGIVTLEDIIEELVGEIYDEHDAEISFHKKINDRTFLFDGNAPISEMNEVLEISDDENKTEASTVSGWIIEQLGEIPIAGKTFSHRNLKIEILKSTVKKVLLCKITVE